MTVQDIDRSLEGDIAQMAGSDKEGKKISVVEQFYRVIKDQIVTLKLQPGQLLLVQRLADEYGISRTPVRETLVRLTAEDLVDEADGRKFRVSEISWKQVEDLYRAREIIEKAAIEYDAANITDKQTKELRSVLSKMEKAVKEQQFGNFFEWDQKFHMTIVRIMDNMFLINWMEKNTAHIQRIRYCTMGLSANMQSSLEEHEEMMHCIEKHDVDRAGQMMERHLENALDNMMKLREILLPNPLTYLK